MKADKDYVIELTEQENVELIRRSVGGNFVGMVFGAGGAALIWRKGEEMPWAVAELGRMRGVGTQGVDGDGI